jgi:hypothetical protein
MTAWWKSPCDCGSKRFESGKTMFTVNGSKINAESLVDSGKLAKVELENDLLTVSCSECGKTQNR